MQYCRWPSAAPSISWLMAVAILACRSAAHHSSRLEIRIPAPLTCSTWRDTREHGALSVDSNGA